jgi:hypothetical protein
VGLVDGFVAAVLVHRLGPLPAAAPARRIFDVAVE